MLKILKTLQKSFPKASVNLVWSQEPKSIQKVTHSLCLKYRDKPLEIKIKVATAGVTKYETLRDIFDKNNCALEIVKHCLEVLKKV